jgi:hypothetical protein
VGCGFVRRTKSGASPSRCHDSQVNAGPEVSGGTGSRGHGDALPGAGRPASGAEFVPGVGGRVSGACRCVLSAGDRCRTCCMSGCPWRGKDGLARGIRQLLPLPLRAEAWKREGAAAPFVVSKDGAGVAGKMADGRTCRAFRPGCADGARRTPGFRYGRSAGAPADRTGPPAPARGKLIAKLNRVRLTGQGWQVPLPMGLSLQRPAQAGHWTGHNAEAVRSPQKGQPRPQIRVQANAVRQPDTPCRSAGYPLAGPAGRTGGEENGGCPSCPAAATGLRG